MVTLQLLQPYNIRQTYVVKKMIALNIVSVDHYVSSLLPE